MNRKKVIEFLAPYLLIYAIIVIYILVSPAHILPHAFISPYYLFVVSVFGTILHIFIFLGTPEEIFGESNKTGGS